MSAISNAVGVDNAVRDLPSRFSELTSEDFVEIIFTELTNQDPLSPNDTTALLEQLNSIRSIESDLELTNRLDRLVTENQLAAAGNLIGREVTGRTDSLELVGGTVIAARREGDDIRLQLENGASVRFNQIETIFDAAPPEPPPVEPPPTGRVTEGIVP